MTTRPCPICGRPAAWEDNPDRPFCSERCRTLDLANWSSETYAVPSGPSGEEEYATDEPAPPTGGGRPTESDEDDDE